MCSDPDCAVPASRLPSLDRLLREGVVAALVHKHGHTLVANTAREHLDGLREEARAGRLSTTEVQADRLMAHIATALERRLQSRLRPVLNLTGTVIHTNLGRAVLPNAAIERLDSLMRSPLNLEYDLQAGGRGDRDAVVEALLCELTGAEAATVVNNNAAAVLLVLAALGAGREAIVSRGELVEIGGAFRMPDVMASAGVTLVEVGTTNRTHLADYERAISPRTALLQKVHTSNYAIQGFTSAVDEAELVTLAHARGLPLVSDLGSGSLVDLRQWGLPAEPTPPEKLRAGCDVVTFSGDKLLGGPQAGLIVGTREAVTRIRRHPLKRALRLSKLPLVALEATLQLYLQPERLVRELPTLRWLARQAPEIAARAQALRETVAASLAPAYAVEVVELTSQIGSGSLPVDRLPSAGLAIVAANGSGKALERLAAALRSGDRPIVGRIADGRMLLDLRCLDEGDVPAVIDSIQSAAASLGRTVEH